MEEDMMRPCLLFRLLRIPETLEQRLTTHFGVAAEITGHIVIQCLTVGLPMPHSPHLPIQVNSVGLPHSRSSPVMSPRPSTPHQQRPSNHNIGAHYNTHAPCSHAGIPIALLPSRKPHTPSVSRHCGLPSLSCPTRAVTCS